MQDTIKSFDARAWAKDFCDHVRDNPGLASDEETMTTWFAAALMRGYDEHNWQSSRYKRQVRSALIPWWKRLFVPLSNFGH